MSRLFERMAVPCVRMEREETPDGEGGSLLAWREGQPFEAAVARDTSAAARVAEALPGPWEHRRRQAVEGADGVRDAMRGCRLGPSFDGPAIDAALERAGLRAEVVALLKTGSAYYAPSAAAARMAKAVVEDSGEIMPVCAWVDGEYGISGVYLGVEAEIGREGVRRVVEGDLTESELAGLREAAEAVRAKQADVADL